MDTTQNYIKYFFILSNIILTAFVIYTGSFIISPLLAAFVVAILLNPIFTRLIKLGIPRILSALFCVFLCVFAILIFISFITAQIGFITSDPSLSSAPFIKWLTTAQKWLANIFEYSVSDQTQLFQESFTNYMKAIVSYLPDVFKGTTAYLTMFGLFFLSVFFFLYYKNFFMSFIYKISGRGNKDRVRDTKEKIKESVNQYINGLFIVILIVAILNSIGLLSLGIRHAIFFGILAALLTIIPYIGILIGSLVPAIFAFLNTNSIWYAIGVILVFSFVQFLEGNFITPVVIGQKENINPYVAILGLFLGGILLGMIGIILAIPILGIIKIVCDDIDALKPIGYVMGNPKDSENTENWFTKLFNSKNDSKKNK